MIRINRTKGGAGADIYIHKISRYFISFDYRHSEPTLSNLLSIFRERQFHLDTSPCLFEVETPFLPPVNRKSCANGCSAISARRRNQMNAWWMQQGKPRGKGIEGMGFGVMCLKIGSKEGIRIPFSILDVPFRQFYGMFHNFSFSSLVNHLQNDDRSLIASKIMLVLQSIEDVDARSITTRLCGQQTKHYPATLQ